MFDFLQSYAKELISTVTPFVILIVNRVLTAPPKLVQGTKHAFTFLINDQTLDAGGNVVDESKNVHTASIGFANAGRSPATSIEITFNWKPQYINIWPVRPYEEYTSPDRRWALKLTSLAPKESITIELLSVVDPLPAIVSARCEQCEAKTLPLVPQIQQPHWKILLFAWLAFAGAVVSLYLLFAVLQFVLLPKS